MLQILLAHDEANKFLNSQSSKLCWFVDLVDIILTWISVRMWNCLVQIQKKDGGDLFRVQSSIISSSSRPAVYQSMQQQQHHGSFSPTDHHPAISTSPFSTSSKQNGADFSQCQVGQLTVLRNVNNNNKLVHKSKDRFFIEILIY